MDISDCPRLTYLGLPLAPAAVDDFIAQLDASCAERTTELVDESSVGPFVACLLDRVLAEDPGELPEWVIPGFARWGTDALAHSIADYLMRRGETLTEDEQAFIDAVIGALVERGTRAALTQVQFLARESMHPELMQAALFILQTYARKQGRRVWEIEDEIVPFCGLDASGERYFEDAGRRFTIHLDDQLRPFLRDVETYARHDELGDDATEEVARSWALICANLEDALPLQVSRLEQALVTQHRWDASVWCERVWHHPLMRLLAQRLVWGQYSETGRLRRTFRVDEEFELLNEVDEAFVLDQELLVGVVHPFELKDEVANAWGQILTDYELVTLCPQFDRTRWRIDDSAKKEREVPIAITGPRRFVMSWLFSRGWARERDFYGWGRMRKVYRAANTVVDLRLSSGVDLEIEFRAAIFRRFLGHPQYPFELRDVDPIVYSETLAELELLREAIRRRV